MARASRSKRSLKGLRLALMATKRLRRVSRAFHTSPMPPAPRAERISYGPSRVPGARVMESAQDYRMTGVEHLQHEGHGCLSVAGADRTSDVRVSLTDERG